jgi:hypothetical protein
MSLIIKSIENKLKSFICDHLIVVDPKIYEKSYEIPYYFNRFETKLIIIWNYECDEYFSILIPSDDDMNEPDIYINIISEDELYIVWIKADKSSSKTRTWIMNLIDHLAFELEISKICLEDQSSVICDDIEVLLMYWRIYNGGRSWYENFGYKPIGIEYIEYEKLLHDYITTPMTIVLQNINKLIMIEPMEKELLGQYMVRISKISFNVYNIFKDHLWELSSQGDTSLTEWVSKMRKIMNHEKFYKHLK